MEDTTKIIPLNVQIGKNIAALRKSQKMTQEELAEERKGPGFFQVRSPFYHRNVLQCLSGNKGTSHQSDEGGSAAVCFRRNRPSRPKKRWTSPDLIKDLLVMSIFLSVLQAVLYFLISRECPVISLGCSMPIISISVGTMSARHPPSFRVYAGS